MFKEARPTTATQVVVEQLLGLIRSGALKAGDRLPSEPDLVQQLKVGRSTVREALRVLTARNLIEVQAGKGSFIRLVDPETVVDSDLLNLLLADEAANALHEVRVILETEMAALAAQRAKPADLAAMGATVEGMQEAAEHGLPVSDHGLSLHVAIAKATHNPVLVKLYRSIIGLLEKHQRPIYDRYADSHAEARSHRELYEAVRKGDADWARAVMHQHLEAAAHFIRQVIKRKNASQSP